MPAPLLGRAFIAAAIKAALGEDVTEEEIIIPVSSTCISEIGYHGGDVISVTFHRGGAYYYTGSRDLFAAFAAAPSKGKFFNDNFR